MTSSDFDLCRDLGHNWNLRGTLTPGSGAALYEQALQCSTCDTKRYRWLDRSGYIIRTWYAYADGYLTPGQGPMTAARRASFRLRNIG